MPAIQLLLDFLHKKEFKKVIEKGNQYLAESPSDLNLLNIISLAYAQDGELNKAHSLLKKAYMLEQTNETTLYNFAKVSRDRKLFDDSINLYKKLIELAPLNIKAKNNLAEIYMIKNKYSMAEKYFLECLRISKNYRLALEGLADIYNKTNNTTKELSVIKNIYDCYPKDTKAVLEYISNLIKNNMLDEAETIICKQRESDNHNVDLMLLTTSLYSKKNLLDDMQKNLKEIIKYHSHSSEAQALMAMCKIRMFNFSSAEKYINNALLLKSKSENTYKNIYFYYSLLCHDDKCSSILQEWCNSYPNSIEARTCLGTHYLAKGEFKKGFILYKYRDYQNSLVIYLQGNKIKKWNLKDSFTNLLVLAEQGIGDEVMFLKFLKYFNASHNVSLCADERLSDIIGRSYESINFISKKELLSNDNNLDSFSHYVFIGDMSEMFITNTNKMALEAGAYMVADSLIVKHYKNNFREKNKVNVGISWHTNNKIRFLSNLRNKDLSLLANYKSMNLINLQYGNHVELMDKYNIKYDKSLDYMQNLNAVFGIISSCDCVITIDNCIAHFAGSLGIKTYLLLAKNADWRWFKNSKKNIWYNNVSLYRQEVLGSYELMLESVVEDINKNNLDKIKP
jgi:Flp pilus assembly protein TadD